MGGAAVPRVQVQVKPNPVRGHARQHLPEVAGQAQARI